MRTAGYGQFVGSGLDRSGGPCGKMHTIPYTPARRGRACPARRCTADGRLRETCGPGMPGPYREAAELMQACPEGPPGGARPSPTNRRERVPHGQTHGKPCTPHVGAGHARPGGVRWTSVCGITCGPGMPGPYREAAGLMRACPESPPGGSRPSPTNRRERVP